MPSGDALTNATNAIEAQAVIDGPEYEAHVRVAHHAGRVYLHLADTDDTVIEAEDHVILFLTDRRHVEDVGRLFQSGLRA